MRNSERGSAPAGEIPLMFNRIKKRADGLEKNQLRVSEKKTKQNKKPPHIYLSAHIRVNSSNKYKKNPKMENYRKITPIPEMFFFFKFRPTLKAKNTLLAHSSIFITSYIFI